MVLPQLPEPPPVPCGVCGGPCRANGTRTPAATVAWSVWVENDRRGGVEACAEDYCVSRNEALLACCWFVTTGLIHEVSGERKRKATWTAWAEHAHRVLGGWDKRTRKLCDPDDYEPAPVELEDPKP